MSEAAREMAARGMAAWVAARVPAPPASLADRVGALYAQAADASDAPLPDAARCVRAAELAVDELIATGDTARTSALDLLAADALATYAFELASADPATLGPLADDAMRRFAALAVPGRRD